MKLSQIKQQTMSFKSVCYEDYNSKYSQISKAVLMETEKFIASGSNAYNLGEGVSGKTFRFYSLPNLVIKTTKSGFKNDYAQEYSNLMGIPSDKIGGQEAVARLYDYDNQKYYLVSTFVNGKTASISNPLRETHLNSLFRKMFELDKMGIYHGDLNGKNILLNDFGDVNFIDYQWLQKIYSSDFYENNKVEKMLLPISVFPENAQMFEMAFMPYYIDSLLGVSAKINFVRDYLKAKSEYHYMRSKYIKENLSDWYCTSSSVTEKSLQEEIAKTKLYKYPDEDILKLELKKIQFLSDYRDAYSHVDPNLPNRNIISSTSSYLCALSAVQDLRKSVISQMRFCSDSMRKNYLNSMLTYGDYWYNNLEKYTRDTFNYITRTLTNNLDYGEQKHDFYSNGRNPREYLSNKDLLKDVGSSYQPSYFNNFDVPYGLQSTMSNMYSPAYYLTKNLYGNIKSEHKVEKIRNLAKESEIFCREEKYLDLLNALQLSILKIRECKSYVEHNLYSSSYVSMLRNFMEMASDYTQHLFNNMFSGLLYSDAYNIIVKGYTDMRKFVSKI